MKKSNLVLVSICIIAFITISMALPFKERNLKVLPKDISDTKLDSIMDTYTVALGEKCNFCHSPQLGDTSKLGFASDTNPMRRMQEI
ncbi:MAG: hypothetical protein WDM90_06970 [Ferruginibacter sp.]